jgi:cytochrome c6
MVSSPPGATGWIAHARSALQVSTAAAASIGLAAAAHADLVNGEVLFDKKCAACHAGAANLIPTFGGKDLSLKALEANGYGAKGDLVNLISKGKGMMPAFGAEAPPYARFDDAQLDDVATYVLTQAAAGWHK